LRTIALRIQKSIPRRRTGCCWSERCKRKGTTELCAILFTKFASRQCFV